MAFLGGAILASTDPVVLRELMRDRRIPRSIKQILKIEAGTNDLIVLPIILILIAVGHPEGRDTGQWAVFLVQLLITGPAIGGLIGALGALLVKRMDTRLNNSHGASSPFRHRHRPPRLHRRHLRGRRWLPRRLRRRAGRLSEQPSPVQLLHAIRRGYL